MVCMNALTQEWKNTTNRKCPTSQYKSSILWAISLILMMQIPEKALAQDPFAVHHLWQFYKERVYSQVCGYSLLHERDEEYELPIYKVHHWWASRGLRVSWMKQAHFERWKNCVETQLVPRWFFREYLKFRYELDVSLSGVISSKKAGYTVGYDKDTYFDPRRRIVWIEDSDTQNITIHYEWNAFITFPHPWGIIKNMWWFY